jgi:hypothetical protein
MRTQLTRLRAALVLLLVGSGLLFAIGSTIERHQHHNEQPAATAGNGESGGSGGESGSEGSNAHVEKSHGEAGVKILGVNTESLALTIVAVVASLLLALAVWLGRWSRPLLLLVAGFGLVFAAGDARELVHQLDESNAGIATIAAILIGLLHLAVAALATALFLRSADTDRSAAAEPAT